MHDLILKNGNIITMEDDNPVVSWIAIEDSKIAAVGKGTYDGEAKEEFDLDGATVLPGLFDAHLHVMPTGFFLASINMLEMKSLEKVLGSLKTACNNAQKDEWVFGAGFMSQNMKEGRFPTRNELDEISNGHPVMVAAQTLHGCAVNSKALETIEVPDVEGVGRYEDGTLNGIIMSDDAAFSVMGQVLAQLPEETLMSYVKECCQYAASKGVTTAAGLLGQFVNGDTDVEIVMKHSEQLPVNIEIFYQTWDIEKVKALGLPRIGGCLTLDGAGFEYTMALQTPYAEKPERRGFLIHTDEEVYNLISKAHEADLQCAFHALGERAIDQLLYCFRQVIGEQGNKDLRHRVEHFSLPSEVHMDMLVEMNLIASMQPAFSQLWGQPEGGFYELLMGRKMADRMEIFPEIIKRGGIICGGSDSPVTLTDPLFGIASCIRNVDSRRNVSVTDALKIFTYNAAYSMKLEKNKGTIKAGKDADFTIIDRNPYEYADSDEIFEMEVLKTIKGGKVTYSK